MSNAKGIDKNVHIIVSSDCHLGIFTEELYKAYYLDEINKNNNKNSKEQKNNNDVKYSKWKSNSITYRL